MAEFDDDPTGEESVSPVARIVTFALPLVTALVALAVGGVLGAIVTYFIAGGQPERVEVPRDLTQAELEAECAPLIADAMTELEKALINVDNLQSQVKAKEARVKQLETTMTKRQASGRNLAKELAAARAELAELRVQLDTAVKERDNLIVELQVKEEELAETKEELSETKQELEVSKEDALQNKWKAFVGTSQLEICEKGGRKKMGKCRETVKEKLGPAVLDKFRHCVRSEQAAPAIYEADKEQRKGLKPLPEFASFLDQDSKITRDWYVLYCDPTLPEADDFEDAPEAVPESPDKEPKEEGGDAPAPEDGLDKVEQPK